MRWLFPPSAPKAQAHVSASKSSGRGATVTSAIKHPRAHPELSRLSKSRGLRSIRFKRTTPGIAARLLLAPSTTPLVSSLHPLSAASPHQLRRIIPQYTCPLFSAHAYPQAVLNRFENPQFFKQMKGRGISNELDDALDNQIADSRIKKNGNLTGSVSASLSSGDRRRAKHTLPMSLIVVSPKKSVHKFAVVRAKVKLRLKEALRLVVIRGARVNPGAPDNELVLDSPEGIQKEVTKGVPVLQGWTYIIRPNLEIYRCPWSSLLDHVGKALVRMREAGDVLERKWGVRKRDQLPAEAERRFEKDSKKVLPVLLEPKSVRGTPHSPGVPSVPGQRQSDEGAIFRPIPSHTAQYGAKSARQPRNLSKGTERDAVRHPARAPAPFRGDADSITNRTTPLSPDTQTSQRRQPHGNPDLSHSSASYMQRTAGSFEQYPRRPTQNTASDRPYKHSPFRSTAQSGGSAPNFSQRIDDDNTSGRTAHVPREYRHDLTNRRSSSSSRHDSHPQPPKSPSVAVPPMMDAHNLKSKSGRLFQSPIVVVNPHQKARRGPGSQGDGRNSGSR